MIQNFFSLATARFAKRPICLLVSKLIIYYVAFHLTFLIVFPIHLFSQSNFKTDQFLIIENQRMTSCLSLGNTFFKAENPISTLTIQELAYLPVENSGEVLQYFPSIISTLGISSGCFNNKLFGGDAVCQNASVALLSDGYRINLTTFAPLPLDIIPLEALRQVDAKQGNAAYRYGDKASGGLINFGDRRNDGYFTTAGLSYGTFNTYNLSFVHGAQAGHAKYKLYADNHSTDGFRENSESKTFSFGGNIQIPVKRNMVAFFNSVNQIRQAEIPGFIAGFQTEDKKFASPVFWHDNNKSEYFIAHAGFRNRFNSSSLVDLKLGFQRININGNATYAGLPPALIGTTPGNYSITGSYGEVFYGNTKKSALSGNHYDLIFTVKSESPEGLGMIEWGAETGYGAYQKTVYDLFKGFENDYSENYQANEVMEWQGDGYVFKTGVFLNGELLLATPLKAQAGLRYDFSTDHFIGQKPDTVMNRQFSAVNPRIGLLLSTGFAENYTGNIYAGYYHAFAFPAPDQRVNFTQFDFLGFEQAGPSLFPVELETPVASDANFKNQRNRTFEIGTFQKFKLNEVLHSEIELTGFSTETNNAIFFSFQTNRFEQIEKTQTNGMEISARLNYKNRWIGFFSYAFADTKILTGRYEEKNIPGMSKNVLSAAAIFNHPSGFFATAALHRKGKMFLDYENGQELKGHFVFNTRSGYSFSFITAYFDVMNLFDTMYYADGFSRNGVNYYYPSAGRRFAVGIKFNL